MRGTDAAPSTFAGDTDRQTDSKGVEQDGVGNTIPSQLLAEAVEREVCQWVCQCVSVCGCVSVAAAMHCCFLHLCLLLG